MEFVSGRCPNCGGEVQLDESKEKGFCLHCGSSIQVKDAVTKLKVELAGKIAVDGLNTIQQLKTNAQRSFDVKEYNNAIRDWKKAIEIDSTDYESYWGQVRCWMATHKAITIKDNKNPFFDDVDINSLIKSALAYAPPHIKIEYESQIKLHNEDIRHNSSRNGCLGVVMLSFSFVAIISLISYTGMAIAANDTEYISSIIISSICIAMTLPIGIYCIKKPPKE